MLKIKLNTSSEHQDVFWNIAGWLSFGQVNGVPLWQIVCSLTQTEAWFTSAYCPFRICSMSQMQMQDDIVLFLRLCCLVWMNVHFMAQLLFLSTGPICSLCRLTEPSGGCFKYPIFNWAMCYIGIEGYITSSVVFSFKENKNNNDDVDFSPLQPSAVRISGHSGSTGSENIRGETRNWGASCSRGGELPVKSSAAFQTGWRV